MRSPLERWIERWNAYWFPETTTLYLSITRIVMVAAQLFWFSPKLERHLNLLEKNSDFINPQLLISGIAGIVSRETLFTPSCISRACHSHIPFRFFAGHLDLRRTCVFVWRQASS